MHLYEYAIIRYVPRVDREEFINVGLLMMCKRAKWMQARINLDNSRLALLRHCHTPAQIATQLNAYTLIAQGAPEAAPMSRLAPEERFRWLTAVKSSCIQTSRPHPGQTDNLEAEFNRLFNEYVL